MFRPEVLASRSSGLMGNVSIAVPVAWQIITCVLFGSLAAALIFLSVATYSRVEIATGTVVPAAGVVPIMPPACATPFGSRASPTRSTATSGSPG